MKVTQPRSLGHWLSWWLAVQTLAGLGAVCLGVYLATSVSLTSRQRSELAQKEQVIRHLVAEASKGGSIDALRHKLDDFFLGRSDLRLVLRAVPSGTIYESSDPPVSSVNYLRTSFEMPWSLSPEGLLRVVMEVDSSADRVVLNRLAWTLLASALIGSVLVSAGGFALVRSALRPVAHLADQLRQRVTLDLVQPLNGSAQAKELQPLVLQFNELLERVRAAHVQLESFNADVAHELRTPLTNLIGECELALRRPRDAVALQEVIGSNLEEIQRLSSIVNDMLFLSRAQIGVEARRQLAPSLAKVARDVIEFHDAALQDADVSALVVGDASGWVDVALLKRALSNLLSNATRFAERGSSIHIRISEPARGSIRLVVANRGRAIPVEQLHRIFDRFYRVDAARQGSGVNHGLGLSIVKAIAMMHGGRSLAACGAGVTEIGMEFEATKPDASRLEAT
ncbi:heavy metal sensor histidine kinase [Rhizobacter sp. LjRoot28]|uniref:heavy metal sensor histidine kinase n=1 Tax=Rhizobacter sp. LjRoot28 TaxID=3342309 RepID=UPI003ECDA731